MHACMHTESLQSCLTLQVPLSMGFCRQEYWRGLSPPPPGDLPHPGIEPASLTSPALAGGFFASSATWEAKECWRGLPRPSAGDLPDPGMESGAPASQADSLQPEPPAASAYVSALFSHTVPPSSSPPVSTSLFLMFVSFLSCM